MRARSASSGSKPGPDGPGPLEEQLVGRTILASTAMAGSGTAARRAGATARGSWSRCEDVGATRQQPLEQPGDGSSTCSQLSSSRTRRRRADHDGKRCARRGHVRVGGRSRAPPPPHRSPRRWSWWRARTAPPVGRGSASASRWPTSIIRRVLPTPPGPIIVISRCRRQPARGRRRRGRRARSVTSAATAAGAAVGTGPAPSRASSSPWRSARAGDGSMPSSSAEPATEVVVQPQRLGGAGRPRQARPSAARADAHAAGARQRGSARSVDQHRRPCRCASRASARSLAAWTAQLFEALGLGRGRVDVDQLG